MVRTECELYILNKVGCAMKKLAIMLFLAVPCTIAQASNEYYKKDLKQQIAQLKIMLAQSNDAYINATTPMYKQSLDLHWAAELCCVFGLLGRRQHFYNAEVILTESNRLAALIVDLEKIEENEQTHL